MTGGNNNNLVLCQVCNIGSSLRRRGTKSEAILLILTDCFVVPPRNDALNER